MVENLQQFYCRDEGDEDEVKRGWGEKVHDEGPP